MTPDLPPLPPGRWLPRLEAAKRLGVTERTLQRRMRDGRVRTRQVSGNRVQVYVPDQDVTRQDSGHDSSQDTAMTTTTPQAIAEALAPLLDRLQSQQALIAQLQDALIRKTEEANRVHLQLKRVEIEQQQAQLAAQATPWWRALWARVSWL